jgi:hypothetical protein
MGEVEQATFLCVFSSRKSVLVFSCVFFPSLGGERRGDKTRARLFCFSPFVWFVLPSSPPTLVLFVFSEKLVRGSKGKKKEMMTRVTHG